MTRRQFTVGGLAALAGAGLGYGFGAEPRWIEETRSRVTLRRSLLTPVRILHLSDLHRSTFVSLSFLEKAIRRGIDLMPDVVCLTGDFITAGDSTVLDGYLEILKLLSSHAPTFAVLGNHDGGAWSQARGGEATVESVSRLLADAGIELLNNRSATVDTKGGPLRLVGSGDLWGGDCHPTSAFENVPRSSSTPAVFLAHNPDTKDLAGNLDWDLMLSGHTHGGQIVIPFIGPPFVPIRDRRFLAGLNEWDGRQIYTTRGVGNLYGVRVNCRPEITLLDVA
jgi:predicted MPP superfamily phosphohydrolase